MEELLNPVQEETAPQQVQVVDIQFAPGRKIYFFDPDGMTFAPGDHVIMDTARGAEFGICAGGNHDIAAKEVVAPLRKILRKATAQDERINEENKAREKRAFEVCTQKIEHHALDMQLVSAECAFDGSKILFYFTADERVDFRELVKDLAGVFHTRIELRQIGVRDKAKMVGGLGICGRPFCCASFLDDFQPVSIKMAKTQNLSLNPTKISGTCGRLMCCLKYEQDTYEDLIRSSPRVDSFVDTPEGRGTVVDTEILRQRVKVRMEQNPDTINVFSNDEIAVLRSGKARKTDPPIPADLAPISGNGKRAPKPKEETAAPVLEPIRFRYSTDTIAEATEASQEPAPDSQERRRDRRPRPEAPKAEPEAETQQPEQARRRPRRDNRRPRPERRENENAPEAAQLPEKPERAPRPPRPEQKPEQKSADPAQQESSEKQPRSNNRRRPPRRGGQNSQNPQSPQPVPANGAPAQPGQKRRPPRGPRPNGEPGAANASSPEGEKPRRRPNSHRPRKPKAPQE